MAGSEKHLPFEYWEMLRDGREDEFYQHAIGFVLTSGHMWCEHGDVMTKLLPLFARNYEGIDVVKTTMAEQFEQCVQCVTVYHNTKKAQKDEGLIAELHKQDIKRIIASLQKWMEQPEYLSVIFYEILHFPKVLDSTELNYLFTTSLLDIQKDNELSFSGDKKIPGLYLLLMHPEVGLRFWAQTTINTWTPIETIEELELVLPIMEKCVNILQYDIFENGERAKSKEFVYSRKEFWTGFSFFLKQFSSELLEHGVIARFPELIDIIMNHLNEDSNIFWNSLTCFQVLVEKLDFKLWSICTIKPSFVLRALIEQCSKTQDEKIHKACFQLIEAVIGSLINFMGNEYMTQRDEVLRFLTDKVDKFINFSSTSKALATTTAWKILHQGTRLVPPSIPYGSVKQWGPRLVQQACPKGPSTGIQQANMKIVLPLLTDILSSATIQMRECCLGLINASAELPENIDWWCGHLWSALLSSNSIPLQLHVLIFKTYKCLAFLDLSAVLEKNSGSDEGSFALEVNSALVKYRQDLYSYLTAAAERIEKGLCGHEELINSVFFLVASPDKLIRASVSEFLRNYSSCGEAGTMAVVIQFYAEKHSKPFFEGVLASIKEVYLSLGVTNCVKSMDNLYFWAERILPNANKIIKENGLRVANEKGEMVVACTKSVARNIVDYMWFLIEDTLKSVEMASQPQLFRIRFLEFLNQFISIFSATDFPSFTKLKPDYQVEDQDELDGTIIQFHDRWMKYFVRIAEVNDAAVLTRWFQTLLSIVKAFESEYIRISKELSTTCHKILTKELAPMLTDAQRTELGKRMPAVGGPVIGNLGMDWHTDLPSFDKAKPVKPVESPFFQKKPANKPVLKTKKVEDNRPLCWWGSLCYRKNPDHLKQFRHPHRENKADSLTADTEEPVKVKKAPIVDLTELDMDNDEGKPKATPKAVPAPITTTTTTTTTNTYTTPSSTSMKQSTTITNKPNPETDMFKPKPINSITSDSNSELDSDFDASKKSEDDAVADLAQDVALAQYKLRMWKEKNANSRKAKVLDLPSHLNRRVGNKPSNQPAIRARTLEDLYKVVLSWDYDNLSSHKDESKMQQIPKKFNSAEDYITIFEPLLMEEILSQIERGKEEADAIPFKMKVVNAGHVNDFTMVDFKHVKASTLESPFSDHDIVLAYVGLVGGKGVRFSLLGKVEKKEKDKGDKLGVDVRVRLYLQSGGKFVSERAKEAQKELNGKAVWFIKRVMSITTANREFTALHTCRNLRLVQTILDPNPSSASASDTGLPGVLGSVFKSKFNHSQMGAIQAGVASNGFALLQGPPGTGKTRTIIGLISALLQLPPSQPNIMQQRGYLQQKTATFKKNKVHIMVCAPSNAAVDEIVLRLTEGVWDAEGKMYKPSIVRVGNPAHVHTLARKFCLENILEQQMADEDSEYNVERKRIVALRDKIENSFSEKNQMNADINVSRKELQALRDEEDDELSLTTKLTDMHRKKDKISDQISALKNSEKQGNKKLDQVKRDMMAAIVENADIVCCTLSSSGSDTFATLTHGFDAVVIDEAAQAIEISTLIPLRYGVKKCIMVGDPNQLPATVLSTTATKFKYEQSLFQRMMESGFPVHMLSMQYRMHPMIRMFPSKHFYDGKLTDGENITAQNYIKPYHEDPRYAPFVFFNVTKGQEARGSGGSLKNMAEVDLAYTLVHSFFQNFPNQKDISIGVITPYKQQCVELKKKLLGPTGKALEDNLEINTVDGFQGREKDIIIFSCVRAQSGGIGFLSDIRRMNVALTRAKFSLLVLGNSSSLTANPHWRAFLDDAMLRDCYINVTDEFYKRPPSRVDMSVFMPMFVHASPSKSQNSLRRSGGIAKSPLKTSSSSISPLKTSSSSISPSLKTSGSSIQPPKTTAPSSDSFLKTSSESIEYIPPTQKLSSQPADPRVALRKPPRPLQSEPKPTTAKRTLEDDTITPNKKLRNDPLQPLPVSKPPNINLTTTNKNKITNSTSKSLPISTQQKPTTTNTITPANTTNTSKPTNTTNDNTQDDNLNSSDGITRKSYNPKKTRQIMLI